MNDIVTIVIVDDHQIFRTGLSLILNGINNYKVIGEAAKGEHLLELLKDKKPDIIFMDIQLPDINGIELTQKVKKQYPQIKIIALTMFGEIEYFNKMIHAGANGFLLKKAENRELQEAIEGLMAGDFHFSKEFVAHGVVKNTKKKVMTQLTKREQEVLKLICEGFSTSEIAEKLFLSNYTVEGYRKSIMSKTGVKNTASMVTFAISNELYSID
jgi:DNA-binding NarL/FixJ family response regulator